MRSQLRKAGLAVVAVLAAVACVDAAYACACCADRGDRIEASKPIGAYEKELIGELKFSGTAQLYLTDAGWEGIRGIKSAAESDTYELRVTRSASALMFAFDDRKGHTGTLNVPIPLQLRTFAVDTTPGVNATGGGGSPKLYKEYVLATAVTGNGMFALADGQPATARLILQGTGNRCEDASQFTHWTLDVADRNASFRFFGRMAP